MGKEGKLSPRHLRLCSSLLVGRQPAATFAFFLGGLYGLRDGRAGGRPAAT